MTEQAKKMVRGVEVTEIPRGPVEPTVTSVPGPGGEQSTVETHPAYGQIRASRVSGQASLYGSDFSHQHYMMIEISESELHRDLSEDRYFGGRVIVGASLSEAQWATFVSSPNAGPGVPCTLEHIQGKRIPLIKRQVDRRTQFEGEAIDRLNHALEKLAALRERLALGKGGKDMLAMLDKAVQEITSNLGFVAKQFGEHMEATIEQAKIEVNAYVQGAVTRAGLVAVGRGRAIHDARVGRSGAGRRRRRRGRAAKGR